jgi:hypothetical protein
VFGVFWGEKAKPRKKNSIFSRFYLSFFVSLMTSLFLREKSKKKAVSTFSV